MTTDQQTTIITSDGEHISPADKPANVTPIKKAATGRKPAGKVRTGNPATDRQVRATSNGSAAKTTATKPARQSAAARKAAQAKTDQAKTTSAKPARQTRSTT